MENNSLPWFKACIAAPLVMLQAILDSLAESLLFHTVKRTPDPSMTSYASDRACSDFKTWHVSGRARSSFLRASSQTTGMKCRTLRPLTCFRIGNSSVLLAKSFHFTFPSRCLAGMLRES